MSELFVNGTQIPSGYTLTIYKYEPFTNRFTPPDQSGSTGYLKLISTSSLVTSMVRTDSDVAIVFESPGYLPWDPQTRGYTGATSTTEQIVIGWGTSFVGGSLSIQQTYVVNVVIKAGRFVSPALDVPSYSLYVNEPISRTYGSDIVFTAPGGLTVTAPFTAPALPPGLSFVSTGAIPSLNWLLTGTPLTGSPSTSYTVYARGSSNASAIISKTFTISIGGERISLAISPSSNVALSVRNEIPPVQITAWYPNLFSGNLRYTWNFLPDGLQFVDISLNPVASPFFPTDANSTIYLLGTPTSTAAQVFKNAGTSNIVANLVATRVTTPNITATQPIDYTIDTFILFDSVTVPTLYRNAPITPGSIVFRANTYFPSSSNMVIMNAPNGLPPGLSLDYTFGNNYAYLVGTPTAEVSATYQIQAVNFSAVSETINVPITVEGDVVQIVGPVDTCYNFVISRPLNSNLAGYYPSNITYTAVSSEGGNPVISVTGFSNTGISVDISGSSFSLSGIPDTITGLTTAVITGSNPVTGATVTKNVKFAVLTDDITLTNPSGPVFPNPQITFFQNQEITPFRFTASTLSGRSVINWAESPLFPLPTGLSISSLGVLTGTPVSNTFALPSFYVVASTGYVSESLQVSYRTIQDDILIALVQDPATLTEQFSNIEYRAVTYSGFTTTANVGKIEPLQNDPITISVSGNYLSGNLGTAKGILPEYRVRLDASYGLLTAEQPYHLIVNNANTQQRLILDTSLASGFVPPSLPKGVVNLYGNDQKTLTFTPLGKNVLTPSNWAPILTTSNADYGYIGDIAQSSNTCILVAGATMYRSSNGGTQWSIIPSSDISSIPGILGFYQAIPPFGLVTAPGPILTTVASDGSSNWLVLGVGYDSNLAGAQRTILRTSSNDGLTWTDVSMTSTFVNRDDTNRLFYNNGRYFLARDDGTNSTYRADASNLSVWTGAAGGMPVFNSAAYTFAFSNDFVLCGGSGGATTDPMYVSSNNGASWTVVSGFSTSDNVRSISRTGSNWFAVTDSKLYFSSNAPTFSLQIGGYTGVWQAIDFDGNVFNIYGYGTSNLEVYSQPYDGWVSGSAIYAANITAKPQLKRAFTHFVDNGPVTASMTLFSSNLPFSAPTITDYTFLQYAGVNIPIQAEPPSGQFVYYYATELPQGLDIVLDSSGISADISGIPTLYDSAPRQFFIFAREPIVPYVGRIPVSYRVLSPFVVKPQSGASGYTAFLRQYVEVNAAQGARDSVALPVEENPIGKFTSPGVPDVITQRVDPKCFSTSNCQ